jgi:hypothetical protein
MPQTTASAAARSGAGPQPSAQGAGARRPHDRTPPPSRSSGRGRALQAGIVAALGALSVVGAPYYALPMAERVRHPLHAWLRPSGYIGQSAGLLALAVFLGLWLYPVRKKLRRTSFGGPISRWLDVHVQIALALPLVVAIHSAWRFGGLIGLGFWSMLVVWASGIVGRYLYVRIPRSKAGVELSREEIATERQALLARIAERTGLEPSAVEEALSVPGQPATAGLWSALGRMVQDDLARRRAIHRFRAVCEHGGRLRRREDRAALHRTIRLAQRELALTQQSRMLDATHALFRYWHVAHRPVAIAALVAVLVHVGVVVALGATWLW